MRDKNNNFKRKIIYFKLNEFPSISETFITNNLVYAKQHGYKIKILVDNYLGISNSSQKELLLEYNIQDDILKKFVFSRNRLLKFFQFLYLIAKPNILRRIYSLYKFSKGDFIYRVSALYNYGKIDDQIVHFHFNRYLEDIVFLTKIKCIEPKCIVTFHGHDVCNNTFVDFTKNNLWFYNNNVKAFTVNSRFLLSKVESLGIDKMKVKLIPPGIDVKLFENKPKSIENSNRIVLLTVGRLVPVKGHTYSIDAVNTILKKGYNVSYIIIGSGIEKESLQRKVNELGISKYVQFYDAMSQIELIPFFHKSDIFLFPSSFTKKGNLTESFGIVSLEAQAGGLPVIGFNSGGFPETIIDGVTGFAVEDKNIEAMVYQIETLINNPKLYAGMSSNAVKHARNYDLKIMTQKYLELYETFN